MNECKHLAPALVSRRSIISTLAAFSVSRTAAAALNARARPRIPGAAPWAVYYGSTAPPDAFAPYRLVVLDPHYARAADVRDRSDAVTLGYVSLGELNTSSPFAGLLRDRSMLIGENPNWPGSVSIDLRQGAWRQFILDDVVPRIVGAGFDGLFLDTLNSALHLENLDNVRFAGMHSAAQSLVSAIRRAHRDIPIMMNRAYALMPAVNADIDAVLTESLVTTYDFVEQRYKWVDDATFAHHLALLRPARIGQNPAPIYSLDYWNPTDLEGIAAIYARQRALGHTPYVATILLDQLVPEPT